MAFLSTSGELAGQKYEMEILLNHGYVHQVTECCLDILMDESFQQTKIIDKPAVGLHSLAKTYER